MAATLDAKQLHEIGKQVHKAVEGGDQQETIVRLLSPLQQWTATEDLLRQSKIGVVVNKLRHNKDTKVASVATQLVNKWKTDVKRVDKKPGSPAPNAAAKLNGAVNGRASGTSSPAPGVKQEVKQARKSKMAPEKRNSAADEVDTAVTGNQTRDGCVKLMYDGLAFMSEEGPDEILIVARNIEMAGFNKYQPETSATYKQKMRSLFQNLKIKGNGDLRRDVFKGTIAPEKFVIMSSDELKSAEKRAADAVLEKENMRVAMTPQEEKAISTTMQCSKCKAKRVAYSQAQTRSADEPMTTFCECMNCRNRWKFS